MHTMLKILSFFVSDTNLSSNNFDVAHIGSHVFVITSSWQNRIQLLFLSKNVFVSSYYEIKWYARKRGVIVVRLCYWSHVRVWTWIHYNMLILANIS